MFTSAKIRNGSTYLDHHLSANDYYAQGERVKGEWLGKGAEALGLSGEVRPEAFEALRINQRPGTSQRLTLRTNEMRHRIEKFEEEQGRKPTVKEIALITRETRPSELKEIATTEVLALQRSQLSPEERRQLQTLRFQAERQSMPLRSGQERNALRASVSHLFERQSVLHEHEVLAEALNQSLGSLDLEKLKQVA